MTELVIDRSVAAKVLATVDAGLVRGLGKPIPGQMCVEAAVCFALGLPHGDDPGCVAPALRSVKISLNEKNWSNNKARAKGLRGLAIAQLGSAGVLDEKQFLQHVIEMTIRKIVPHVLRAAAGMEANAPHSDKLEAAAKRCEAEGTKAAARAACAIAVNADAYTNAAVNAAYTAACATDATSATRLICAVHTADAYPNRSEYPPRDESLAFFAEEVVQILIAMKAPGTAWLDLTEAA